MLPTPDYHNAKYIQLIALSTQLNVVVFSTYFALRLLNVFASNDTLFNLLRIYFEHKVHSPQCNNALSDANYIQLDVVCIEGVGALKDFSSKPLQTNWVLVAHQPTAPPVVWSIDGIDISLSCILASRL